MHIHAGRAAENYLKTGAESKQETPKKCSVRTELTENNCSNCYKALTND